MAHFAKINDQGVVTTVIVAEQDFIDTLDDSASWVQTSYNTYGGKHYDPETREEDDGTPLRKNFAGIGFKYDSTRDAFIPPQNFPSWVLNEETCQWESPLDKPQETDAQLAAGQFYIWNEETYQADNTQGWVLVGGGVE
jgi:hypothetical protein